MSIEGRIDINVLFHDKDGQRLKIVSLNDSQEYPSGKVALFSGTADTNGFALPLSPSTYRDASGQLVSFASISKAVVKAESGMLSFVRWDFTAENQLEAVLGAGDIAVIDLFDLQVDPELGYGPSVSGKNAAAGYTIILYGT